MSSRKFVLNLLSSLRSDVPADIADVLTATADVIFCETEEQQFRSVRNVVRYYFGFDIASFIRSSGFSDVSEDAEPPQQFLLMEKSTVPESDDEREYRLHLRR